MRAHASRAGHGSPAGAYADRTYAEALGHVGRPCALPRSGGWLLHRSIRTELGEGQADEDAVGPYPFFSCENWGELGADLAELDGPVSVTLVTDPFGSWNETDLTRAFPDLARPFKEHLVCDLSIPLEEILSSHHKRYSKSAAKQCAVTELLSPVEDADAFAELYASLIVRHDIHGPAAFPPESLRAQLAVPGVRLFAAHIEGELVGMVFWYVRGDVVSYHLAAYSQAGYEARASYALFHHALVLFGQEGLAWAHLGAGAGLTSDEDDGLTRFKRGWSTTTRSAWLCGRVCNRAAYERLSRDHSGDFFPAYRGTRR